MNPNNSPGPRADFGDAFANFATELPPLHSPGNLARHVMTPFFTPGKTGATEEAVASASKDNWTPNFGGANATFSGGRPAAGRSLIPQLSDHHVLGGTSPRESDTCVRVGKTLLELSKLEVSLELNMDDRKRQSLDSATETPDMGNRRRLETPEERPKTKACRCKKSKCIQQYCDCFREGEYCKGCDCVDCHNDPQHQDERQGAIDRIRSTNPTAFKKKVKVQEEVAAEEAGETQVHIRGCQCKKSKCQKKYCECFQYGVLCSDKCRCQECCNREPTSSEPKSGRRAAVSRDLAVSSGNGILNQLTPPRNNLPSGSFNSPNNVHQLPRALCTPSMSPMFGLSNQTPLSGVGLPGDSRMTGMFTPLRTSLDFAPQ